MRVRVRGRGQLLLVVRHALALALGPQVHSELRRQRSRQDVFDEDIHKHIEGGRGGSAEDGNEENNLKTVTVAAITVSHINRDMISE
jgi:hypothetical protein